ncbi:MAG: hypothetical protein Q9191_003813, partial [Dirinaria sp. TL-2023a]
HGRRQRTLLAVVIKRDIRRSICIIPRFDGNTRESRASSVIGTGAGGCGVGV